MANPEHLAIIKKGVKTWNDWRRTSSPTFAPDLSSTDFSGEDLSGAHLYGANLNTSRLVMADLSGAWLTGASLVRSDLTGANLTGAHLVMADFRRATIQGVDLSRAIIGWTVFGFLDFRNVDGLTSVIHEGPSLIGVESIYRSDRHFPSSFLRGCGFPDQLIDYLPSLLHRGVQFHSCFISYSTKDQQFADRIHADLQSKGIRCWFAPHDVHAGRKLHEQIDEAIRLYDRLLLILSDHSMNSEWVKTEIAHARRKELNGPRQILFPISVVPFAKIREWKCFDADTGNDSAREIREYFIPDFSNWKDHDSYQRAFLRLVEDLRSAEKKA